VIEDDVYRDTHTLTRVYARVDLQNKWIWKWKCIKDPILTLFHIHFFTYLAWDKLFKLTAVSI